MEVFKCAVIFEQIVIYGDVSTKTNDENHDVSFNGTFVSRSLGNMIGLLGWQIFS